MRYLRFIAVISLMLVAHVSYACFNPWYSDLSYSIYRLDERALSEMPSKRMENLKEWQMMTSTEIAIEDIERVVYTMSLEEYEAFYNAEHYSGPNAFARWIKEYDNAIMEFLLLAKRNEHIRFQYNSLWYYPSMKIKGPTTLEEIVELSLENKEERLHHRYLVQAIRALYTLNRYEECIKIWNEEFDGLERNHTMRRHAHMYMAGALYNTGNVEQALTEYAEIGDIESILYIAKREGIAMDDIDLMEILYRNNPDNQEMLTMMFDNITHYDGNPFADDYDAMEACTSPWCARFAEMATRLASEGYDPALWNYTAAYLYALMNQESEAREAIARAEKSKTTPFMRDSIEVMKIFIDAKFCKLDKRYYSRLHKQLAWLNDKIKEHSPAAAKWYDYETYYYVFPMSYDYWKTTQQMVVNTVLCPRLMAEGQEVLALQLANMSSYYVAKVIDCVHHTVYCYEQYSYLDYGYCTLEEYRHSRNTRNDLDYVTFFAFLVNVVDTDAMQAYLDIVAKPATSFEEYLNECGYTDISFLSDIMGMRYIRDMRYEEAERVLANVAFEYNYVHNLKLYYDPFDISAKRKVSRAHDFDFRYRFAKRMAELERAIAKESDPNRRAKMTIELGYGMASSVTHCWKLAYYQSGYIWAYSNYLWESEEHPAKIRGYELINEGLEMFTDLEAKAEMLYRFGNLYTVGREFKGTYYGDYVLRHCDNLCDYLMNLPKEQRREKWYYGE